MKVRILRLANGEWGITRHRRWVAPQGYAWREEYLELVRFDDIFGFEGWIMADFFIPQTDAWIFI